MFPLIFLPILSLHSPIFSADITTFIYKGYTNQNFQDPTGISFQNLQTLYSTLIFHSDAPIYQTSTATIASKQIPGIIGKLCGSDGDTIAARVQLDGCYLRYKVIGFPPASATDLLYKQCGSTRVSGLGFESRLELAFGKVVKGVVNGKGYYYGQYESVYVLGQCANCVKSTTENGRSACAWSIFGQISGWQGI